MFVYCLSYSPGICKSQTKKERDYYYYYYYSKARAKADAKARARAWPSLLYLVALYVVMA